MLFHQSEKGEIYVKRGLSTQESVRFQPLLEVFQVAGLVITVRERRVLPHLACIEGGSNRVYDSCTQQNGAVLSGFGSFYR